LDDESEAIMAAQRFSDGARDLQGEGFGRSMFIQDPYDLDVNLARFVTDTTSVKLKGEFVRAARILSAPTDRSTVLSRLFAK
jgi:hypothetical protein